MARPPQPPMTIGEAREPGRRGRGRAAASPCLKKAFNVRVKLVEPGYGPTTRFGSNSGQRMLGLIPEEYGEFAQQVFAEFTKAAAFTTEADVAVVVWRAVNDESRQLRFPAGPDAVALAQGR